MELGRGPVSFGLGVISDASDTWGHGVRGFGEPEGYFEPDGSAVDVGPLASTMVVRRRWDRSTAEMVFRIYEGLPLVDVWVTVHWMETRKLLKLVLEPDGGIEEMVAQGAGGAWPKRAHDAEEPLHGWLLGGPVGLMQDGAFAFDHSHERIRLTLVRSSLYAFHDPHKVDPLGPLNHTDLGEHRFRMRFVAADGLANADMDRLFAEFIEPFRVLRQNA
jgi:alpha-mannosidase